MHLYSHTRMHTLIHAQSQTHTHMHTRTCKHTHARVPTPHPCARTHTLQTKRGEPWNSERPGRRGKQRHEQLQVPRGPGAKAPRPSRTRGQGLRLKRRLATGRPRGTGRASLAILLPAAGPDEPLCSCDPGVSSLVRGKVTGHTAKPCSPGRPLPATRRDYAAEN